MNLSGRFYSAHNAEKIILFIIPEKIFSRQRFIPFQLSKNPLKSINNSFGRYVFLN